METSIKVKLQPFRVPNFVLVETEAGTRQDGFKESPKYSLSELDFDTLEKLCADFKTEVFRKASIK